MGGTDAAADPGRELGLEDLACLDLGLGVVVVVEVDQLLAVQTEDAGQGAQVSAGVEVAAAGLEVVDLDALQDVGSRPSPP